MLKANFDMVINTLGYPGQHESAVTGVVTLIPKLTLQSLGRAARAEEALVNAYGVDSMQIHLMATSLPAAPQKFDIFTVSGQRLIAQGVMAKREETSGDIIGYQVYVKGD